MRYDVDAISNQAKENCVVYSRDLECNVMMRINTKGGVRYDPLEVSGREGSGVMVSRTVVWGSTRLVLHHYSASTTRTASPQAVAASVSETHRQSLVQTSLIP